MLYDQAEADDLWKRAVEVEGAGRMALAPSGPLMREIDELYVAWEKQAGEEGSDEGAPVRSAHRRPLGAFDEIASVGFGRSIEREG